jgi:hypothetical protein
MRYDYSRAARIAPTAGHLTKSHNKRFATSKRARGKRARGFLANERLPFVPPEDWHEPREDGSDYRFVIQNPGDGYRHVLTPNEVRQRLAELPEHCVEPLEVVQFSRMTRKKQSFPCYGMQWGSAIYLYPIENDLVEHYDAPPKPNLMNEVRMYGGRWETHGHHWKLVWTEQAIKDFYLNNILIHELGHLLDDRNTRSVDRERYAEWFAIRYGYKPTQAARQRAAAPAVRRHAKR